MLTKQAAPVLEVKELGESGSIVGYASTFGGEPDSYGDIIQAGAYAESLATHAAKGSMPKLFWQHDSHEPIGRWTSAKEDDHGLLVEGRLNMDVQRGREAHALLKAGDIDGLSIGYRIVEYTHNREDETWLLTKLDLIEVSVVSVPANVNATVGAVKAARRAEEITEKLKAGDRLTEREFEALLKGTLGLSNSEAERAARIHLKGQGEPAEPAEPRALEFLRAMTAA
ncbi:HK97 family phage prohead protease [Wenxinia saemankumensis]|uniref:Prohead serine protease domain-containing protein n=1 Tax=Wenxinia saemankumensis TaxID=1447782 RepID=A0A1M6EZL8_9RHOB|nr:HK97 family phage prohead protease [Wenxinia saemankumensis]SHI90883.1 hypothetical protein SAMN05444417_2268 [Wenxinia saemankumensis]